MPDTMDKRVADLEQMVGDIPDLLNIRFSRVDRDIASVRQSTAELAGSLADIGLRLTRIERSLEALPRVLAEMLNERKR